MADDDEAPPPTARPRLPAVPDRRSREVARRRRWTDLDLTDHGMLPGPATAAVPALPDRRGKVDRRKQTTESGGQTGFVAGWPAAPTGEPQREASTSRPFGFRSFNDRRDRRSES
jgi:hypothetical protein